MINFLPFFLIGYYFKTNSIPQKLWKDNLSKVILVMICLIVLVGYNPFNADILLKGADSYNMQDLPFKVLLFMCAIVSVFSIWNLRTEIPFLSKYGKDSLFYYIYHGLIIEFFISPIVVRFHLPTSLLNIVIYIILVFLILRFLNRIPLFKWLINPVFKF